MRIAMIGTGYVGLVSGACFADFGHHVTCVDKDEAKIAGLDAGRMPIWEPGLEGLVKANVDRGRLEFTTNLATGVAGADAVFIAVGTPARRGDGHADLSYVFGAVRELAKVLDRPVVVVTKSTVPVGTGDQIARLLTEEGAPEGTSVASNPEFLREGAAIRDFKIPDRIVIGAEDERAREVLREIYRPLFLNEAPILFTGRRTAELTKYAANAFLATKISFINEMADLCEAIDADVQDVARGIGLDNRIGPKFLHAGPGYGGSCFPKDTLALLQTAKAAGVEQRIVSTVVGVNDDRKDKMAARVADAVGGLKGKRIAVLGLAFKPNTDDMRDAPSIPLVGGLLQGGATVVAFDPVAMEQARPLMPDVTLASDAEAAARDADALVIVTEWDEFRALNLTAIAAAMKGKVLVDLRNVYDRSDAARAGLSYFGVGRGRLSGK
ncbi:MAG TPA: UDP-glucose/GDP-mannose dehydrogenase family protein [Sphingomicrobium sp.]|nr:UDP-glucose/GDP-mannose dehydrogenase family protein [Sphingomicrobium sp.]